MRVLRRVADKMRMRGNTASDVQVLQMLGAPSLEVALQKNRLSYLASLLRSPAVHLRALIAMRTPEGNKQPWAVLVQQGLEEMFKMFPFKLAELGHPAETPDAWHDFICNHPEAWKSLVRMWARQATVQGLGQDSRPCKRRRTAGPAKEGGDKAHPHVCGLCNVGFSSWRGFQQHDRKVHGARCSAKWYADSNGRCPVCFKIFPSRLRLVAHLTEKRSRGGKVPCGPLLGNARRLPADRVAYLDSLDTLERAKARREGKTQPTVGGRKKRPAQDRPFNTRKRLRTKTTLA